MSSPWFAVVDGHGQVALARDEVGQHALEELTPGEGELAAHGDHHPAVTAAYRQ